MNDGYSYWDIWQFMKAEHRESVTVREQLIICVTNNKIQAFKPIR